MIALDFPKTLVNFYQTTWDYISEDNTTFIVTAIRTSYFMYSKFARQLFMQIPNRKFDQLQFFMNVRGIST